MDTNQLKEQARKEFDWQFTYDFDGRPLYSKLEIKDFIDSIIDRTEKATEERIVGLIKDIQMPQYQDEGSEHAHEGFVKALEMSVSLITNKSDLSSN